MYVFIDFNSFLRWALWPIGLLFMFLIKILLKFHEYIFNLKPSGRCFNYIRIAFTTDRRGCVEVERPPRVREIGVRSIPLATDPSRKNSSDSSTAKRSATGVSVTGPRRWSF